MNAVVQPPVELNCLLSPQLLLLGDALVPVANSARSSLHREGRSSGREFVVLDDLIQHVGVIEHALSSLTPRLNGLMTDVIRNDAADMLEVGRSVGRFEQVLSELVDAYLEVNDSQAGPDSKEARRLMLGIYRHHIQTLCDWLDQLIDSIKNPAIELKRRGIEPADHVVMTISLNMTIPAEMVELEKLINAKQSKHAK